MPDWITWILIGVAFVIALTINHNVRAIGYRVEEEITALKDILSELEKANRRHEPDWHE